MIGILAKWKQREGVGIVKGCQGLGKKEGNEEGEAISHFLNEGQPWTRVKGYKVVGEGQMDKGWSNEVDNHNGAYNMANKLDIDLGKRKKWSYEFWLSRGRRRFNHVPCSRIWGVVVIFYCPEFFSRWLPFFKVIFGFILLLLWRKISRTLLY